jgi:hypothetical protein
VLGRFAEGCHKPGIHLINLPADPTSRGVHQRCWRLLGLYRLTVGILRANRRRSHRLSLPDSFLRISAAATIASTRIKCLPFLERREMKLFPAGRHRPSVRWMSRFEFGAVDLGGERRDPGEFLVGLEEKSLQALRRAVCLDIPPLSARPERVKKAAVSRACRRDQGGPTPSAVTKGRPGGNEPIGKHAMRSPARRRSEASRNAATKVA